MSMRVGLAFDQVPAGRENLIRVGGEMMGKGIREMIFAGVWKVTEVSEWILGLGIEA
jgi:hypothetical protein